MTIATMRITIKNCKKAPETRKSSRGSLSTECHTTLRSRELHDRANNIAIVVLEGLHRLRTADASLRDHELDVLRLQASLVHDLIITRGGGGGRRGRDDSAGTSGLRGLRNETA